MQRNFLRRLERVCWFVFESGSLFASLSLMASLFPSLTLLATCSVSLKAWEWECLIEMKLVIVFASLLM